MLFRSIVNDGSTDNTMNVAKSFCEKDKRFKYMEQKNEGLSSARNSGLDSISGDFIQFLDSDDLLISNKFEVQLESMLNDSSIDICISRYKLFSKEIETAYEDKISTTEYDCSLDGFLYAWEDKFSIPPNCYLIKKKFIDKNKIRFNEDLMAMEDWFFIVESTAKKARFYVNEQCLALYRKHNNNMSNDYRRMSKSLITAAISIVDLLPENKKTKYRKEISEIIFNRLLKSFGERENSIKANSIDYKAGYVLLFLFHRISSVMKQIVRLIK